MVLARFEVGMDTNIYSMLMFSVSVAILSASGAARPDILLKYCISYRRVKLKLINNTIKSNIAPINHKDTNGCEIWLL